MRLLVPNSGAIQQLIKAAEGGDREAMLCLSGVTGSGLGAPRSAERALELVQSAYDAGSGVAACVLGVQRLQTARSDDQALSAAALLAEAAGRGDTVASAVMDAIDASTLTWRDLQAVQDAPARQLRDKPQLSFVRGLISRLETFYLMSLAVERLGPSTVSSVVDGPRRDAAIRSSFDVSLSPWSQDIVVQTIADRICRTVGRDRRHAEPLSIIRYVDGGFFSPHYDSPPEAFIGHADHPAGPREISFIAYLNDDYDGGETAFPSARFQIKGAAGDAIFFGNQTAEGRLDPASLHGALPVARGEKWVLVGWFTRAPIFHELEDTADNDARPTAPPPPASPAVASAL